MIVNIFAGPGQLVPPLVNVGVTVIVPVIGQVPALVPVKEMSPIPLAARPMPVLLLFQEYDVVPPPFTVVKETVPVPLLHITVFKGWVTCPVGLTVIVNIFEGPVQLTDP